MKAKSGPKDEALLAIDAALADLAEDEISGFLKSQIVGGLTYAKQQIALIQELKRPRKAKEAS